MRRHFILCIALLSQAALGAGPACSNPALASPGDYGAGSRWSFSGVHLADAPHAFPDDAKVCTAFKGQQTCCSDSTLSAIDTASKTANTAISTAFAAMRSVKPADVIINAVDALCKTLHCDAKVQGTIDSYRSKFNDAQTKVLNAEERCSKGSVGLMEGMACFMCLADPEKYLDTTAKRVRLAQATCDNVYDACSPMYSSYKSLVSTVIAFVNELAKDLGSSSDPIDPDILPTLCGGSAKSPGDCKTYLCHNVINGFAVPIVQWSSKAQTLLAAQAHTAAHHPRQHAVTRRAAQQVLEYLAATSLSPETVRAVEDSTSHTEYSDDGYDAYKVGCEDEDCPKPSNGGFPKWAIAVIAVGAAVVVGAAGFFVFKKCTKPGTAEERRTLV